jgi:hypothetical protein
MLLEHTAHVAVAAFVGLGGLLMWAFGVYMKKRLCVYLYSRRL